MKTAASKGKDSNFYFFRDNNHLEVNLLVESGQSLVPIKIKVARTFSFEFIRAFSSLQKLDSSFSHGVVIYFGELETAFEDSTIINFSSISKSIWGMMQKFSRWDTRIPGKDSLNTSREWAGLSRIYRIVLRARWRPAEWDASLKNNEVQSPAHLTALFFSLFSPKNKNPVHPV